MEGMEGMAACERVPSTSHRHGTVGLRGSNLKVSESEVAWGCWSQLLDRLCVPDQLLEGSFQKVRKCGDMLREEFLLLCKMMGLQAKHSKNKV